jgi:hypothetical protein
VAKARLIESTNLSKFGAMTNSKPLKLLSLKDASNSFRFQAKLEPNRCEVVRFC